MYISRTETLCSPPQGRQRTSSVIRHVSGHSEGAQVSVTDGAMVGTANALKLGLPRRLRQHRQHRSR
jgi:hypothetical protein